MLPLNEKAAFFVHLHINQHSHFGNNLAVV